MYINTLIYQESCARFAVLAVVRCDCLLHFVEHDVFVCFSCSAQPNVIRVNHKTDPARDVIC
jgi:hypothetical protein